MMNPTPRPEETRQNAIALMEELFGDTEFLLVSLHPSLPDEIKGRMHKMIRHATAIGGASLEIRTWVSELQVACGDQGVSWVRDWPEEDERIRHVQLLEWRGWGDERECIVLWSTSPLDLEAEQR